MIKQIHKDFRTSERVMPHEKHPLSQEEMIGVCGNDVWEHFKNLSQTTQMEVTSLAFGECSVFYV